MIGSALLFLFCIYACSFAVFSLGIFGSDSKSLDKNSRIDALKKTNNLSLASLALIVSFCAVYGMVPFRIGDSSLSMTRLAEFFKCFFNSLSTDNYEGIFAISGYGCVTVGAITGVLIAEDKGRDLISSFIIVVVCLGAYDPKMGMCISMLISTISMLCVLFLRLHSDSEQYLNKLGILTGN